MKTRDQLQALADKAPEGYTFSNGTEGYAWTGNWCDNCVHDKPAREERPEDGCPLLAASLMGHKPNEWVDGNARYLGETYRCTEFAQDPEGDVPVFGEPEVAS